MKKYIDKLEQEHILSHEEFIHFFRYHTTADLKYLFERARVTAKKYYGRQVYTRGLIEFSNYCKNDCYYCGIRRSNKQADRYRLSPEQIMECCQTGYDLGFRTFVLQGGEDPYFTDARMISIISAIRTAWPDCAITLSIGEKSRASYQAYFDAGANRFLLRHETASNAHYRLLHPSDMSLDNRKRCLHDLKEIGYQVGTGFMVGSPGQTYEYLAEDLYFIHELQPQMVGIGPYVSHHQTPFADKENGTLELTLLLIGFLRLMLPDALLPATTSLGTIHPEGREKGVLAGANVVMPNLSPVAVRAKYALYDNKICTGDEAAECRMCLNGRMQRIGYELVQSRGDHPTWADCP